MLASSPTTPEWMEILKRMEKAIYILLVYGGDSWIILQTKLTNPLLNLESTRCDYTIQL
jgi:hypothetical protein